MKDYPLIKEYMKTLETFKTQVFEWEAVKNNWTYNANLWQMSIKCMKWVFGLKLDEKARLQAEALKEANEKVL